MRVWSLLAVAGMSLGLVTNAVAQDCTANTDCAEGQVCELDGDPGANIPCAEGADCPAAPVDAGVPTGYCTWPPMLCAADADCLEGLTCELNDAPCAPGETCEAATQGECERDEIDCATDADCAEHWECLATTSERCETSVCVEGQDCGAAQNSCTTEESRQCFPKRVDCESDADCEGEWRCVMFPPNGADEDAPAEWQGATMVCMPEGLALELESEVGSASGSDGSGSDGSGSESVGSNDSAGNGSTSDSSKSETANPSSDNADGCSVAHVGVRAGSVWVWFAALMLALRTTRSSCRSKRRLPQ
jgi:hypothetical protein